MRLHPISVQGFRGSPIVAIAAASLSDAQATIADETPTFKAA